MTIESQGPSVLPEQALKNLLHSENAENNNLIDIMGKVKPTRSGGSSLTSLIRGLFTKNTKLLGLLNSTLTEFASYEDANEMDLLKSFVNEFLIWLDQDGFVLFEKYCSQITDLNADSLDIEAAAASINADQFCKPILNCHNYVTFIDDVSALLRNPFILEQLSKAKSSLQKLLDTYTNKSNIKRLNSISFNNIKAFINMSPNAKSTRSPERVSSFFKVNQITERSGDETLFLCDSKQRKYQVELILLNLMGEQYSNSYNALAIVEVCPDATEASRSLMYPPFRINELSINFEQSSIILKSISFSSIHTAESKLTIMGSNQAFLTQWYKKLLIIFPLELNNTPVSETFLIKSNRSPPKMSGLGINVLSDVDHRKTWDEEDSGRFETPLNSSKSNTFKELIRSPSLSSSSPLSQLQQQFQQQPQKRTDPEGAIDSIVPQPAFLNNTRKNSNSSLKSNASSESLKSQYDRSLSIINKALTNTSSSLLAKKDDNHIKVVPREVLEAPISDYESRPRSSQGEISYVEDTPKPQETNDNESRSPYKQKGNAFNSVPDLTKTKGSIYKLSTGSAVDLSNFGKSYNPSFSIPKGLSDLAQEDSKEPSSEKPRRKSFFNFLKKSNKKTNVIVSGSPRLPQSPILVNDGIEAYGERSGEQLQNKTPSPDKSILTIEVSQSLPIKSTEQHENNGKSGKVKNKNNLAISVSLLSIEDKGSNLPSPFALPSSTSTYFFKHFKNGNAETELPTENNEGDLRIPQNLKDTINSDPSLDFFMTESAPKAMKISRWKQKYGKWELITANENLFIKIVVNYELNKCWFIVFKEEFDEEVQEDIDIPILLLDIDEVNTALRQSSALDLQLQAINSITSEKMLIIIRCRTGSLVNSLVTSITNIMGVLTALAKSNKYTSLISSKHNPSDGTISSSIMDSGKEKKSESSTLSSISSQNEGKTITEPSKLRHEHSSFSISTQEINNAQIINNPNNSKFLALSETTVRLQKQMGSYDEINVLSSWKILSMYSLSVQIISDVFTNKDYFNLVLKNTNEDSIEEDFDWLISEEEKFDRIERIGKAGLLIRVTDLDYYMVECRGKKEFRQLFEVF
ncbi:uncharacterized protein CANTADRAFT_27249 [Suhomyces tanzawaensis NRRL Y-17324]|uniref:PH-like domain-containing protein n=1 Tax=Suhomyces tanzawaensis NRRL Y-17324 TaxID=984487 RepID=A0A1E4SD65_9ASCO|nr:uncharacterized protein CANTADRAFT_27249 [Suhomyces tanzawaensis NRRL Y-17324]ODV77423.1 hypothetical protein CANTADRAFT_27249 [Suhomyces tanzawaensis NRRL Y-17324]